MADSDDEYDRKRRDKFRGERTESYREGRGREDRRRGGDDWPDSEPSFREWSSRPRTRPDYREYRGGGRERYSPARSQDMAPPMKRMRGDWEDRPPRGHNYGDYYGRDTEAGVGGGGGGGGGGRGSGAANWGQEHYTAPHHGNHHYSNHSNNSSSREVAGNFSSSNVETQPPMMTFKAFLGTQEDSITDEEAIKRYNEYKLEFRRQQLNEFFIAHKDEEWFKIKYHPEESVKRKEEQFAALKKRVEVFLGLLDKGEIDKVTVDADQTDALLYLLDAVVIKLEGGTEEDLKILDIKPPSQPTKEPTIKDIVIKKEEDKEAKDTVKVKIEGEKKKEEAEKLEEKKEEPEAEETKEEAQNGDVEMKDAEDKGAEEETEAAKEDEKKKDTEEETKDEEEEKKEEEEVETEEKAEESNSKKRKRSNSNSSTSSSSSSSSSDSADSTKPATPPGPPPEEKEEEEEEGEEEEDKEKEEESEKASEDKESEKSAKEDTPEPQNEKPKKKASETVIDLANEKEPRALHKTSSIFLRNLAPTITKAEVEAMCKRFPGFLRVAIADPQPERRWFRRGWVSFERQVNIKEICWSLNNIRLRDCELGAIVNRDLSRRIRTVNGLTCHKQIVRNDIKLSAKIVHNLDGRSGLWVEEKKEGAEEEAKKEQTAHELEQAAFGLTSKNPVLKNITDYLIEEASAEEEELLGVSGDHEEGQLSGEGEEKIERDPSLLKVLDRLILYLRIVHSVDYYNHCEYPNEDEMPNRCGIMHVRGSPPTTKVASNEIMEYCKNFESKMAAFLAPIATVTSAEYDKLGHKNAETEVEKFVQANTQELSKDKWLCPLSGKKFKGPDFIRKHIFNKHGEKVAEVKAEAEYFNNYLKDPKRPQLPEHPGNKAPASNSSREGYSNYNSSGPRTPARFTGNYGGNFGGNRGGFGGGYPGGFGGGFGVPRQNRGGFNRGRAAPDSSRPLISYNDLDQLDTDFL